MRRVFIGGVVLAGGNHLGMKFLNFLGVFGSRFGNRFTAGMRGVRGEQFGVGIELFLAETAHAGEIFHFTVKLYLTINIK